MNSRGEGNEGCYTVIEWELLYYVNGRSATEVIKGSDNWKHRRLGYVGGKAVCADWEAHRRPQLK